MASVPRWTGPSMFGIDMGIAALRHGATEELYEVKEPRADLGRLVRCDLLLELLAVDPPELVDGLVAELHSEFSLGARASEHKTDKLSSRGILEPK